jgi:putative NADH-flavin reductase
MRFLILGATGKSGQAFTQQALDRGHEVTVLVRSPQTVTIRNDRLTVVAGDPSTTAAIESALRGHDAVLSALGRSTGEDILSDAISRPDSRSVSMTRCVATTRIHRGELASPVVVGDPRAARWFGDEQTFAQPLQ